MPMSPSCALSVGGEAAVGRARGRDAHDVDAGLQVAPRRQHQAAAGHDGERNRFAVGADDGGHEGGIRRAGGAEAAYDDDGAPPADLHPQQEDAAARVDRDLPAVAAGDHDRAAVAERRVGPAVRPQPAQDGLGRGAGGPSGGDHDPAAPR